jgi:hypothetical protein
MKATSTIPIVGIDLESDPVASGWAKTLNRPGCNFTGLFLDLPELGGKQLQLLKETVPSLSHVAVLWDSAIGDVQFQATAAAGRSAGFTVQSLPIQHQRDFIQAFDRAVRETMRAVDATPPDESGGVSSARRSFWRRPLPPYSSLKKSREKFAVSSEERWCPPSDPAR